MARLSKTGGNKTKAKARKARPAKGRKTAKGQSRIAPTATRRRTPAAAAQETEVAQLKRQLKEAREQQRASADILRVISQSPTDVQPVFDGIVKTAVRLLGCDIAFVILTDGKTFSPAAAASPDGLLADMGPANLPVDPEHNFPSRAIVAKTMLHLPDWSDIEVPEHERQMRALLGVATALFLPLLSNGHCIGLLAYAAVRPNIFGVNEIALAESFRDQALIAIENARLFDEVQQKTRDLEESLQQQTTTADVLKVISRSAFDLDSVMNTLTQSAAELCKAETSALYLREGDVLVVRGVTDMEAGKADFLRRTPLQANSLTYVGRAILAGSILNIADVDIETDIGFLKRFGEVLGFKAILFVPLMREGRGIGVFALGRKRTGQFSQREVDLLQTFADQAVIAIENTRLFNETKEALEQQKASAEILSVISNSVADTQPVFDKILESCKHLFGGKRECSCKMCPSLCNHGVVPERYATIVMRHERIRIDPERRLVLRDRVITPAHVPQNIAEIVSRAGVFRTQRDRTFRMRERFRQTINILKQKGKMDVRISKIGTQRNGVPIMPLGIPLPANYLQHRGQIQMRNWRIRCPFHDQRKLRFRFVETPKRP